MDKHSENDRDQDGCHDDTNDDDDDGDGIVDIDDACLDGEVNWPANLYNDWDQDGCNDLLEDADDDNDGEFDVTDGCPKVARIGKLSVQRTQTSTWTVAMMQQKTRMMTTTMSTM